QLDLEAQSIEANDIDCGHQQVGADEDHSAACWMIDQHEAHELLEGPPHQIETEKANREVALAVDGAVSALPGLGGGVEQGPQLDFLAVEARTPAFARSVVGGHG